MKDKNGTPLANDNKPSGEADILLVEDNLQDAELMMRALKKRNLANHIVWVKDGVQALDYVMGINAFSERGALPAPKVVVLDLKLPKIDGLGVLRQLKSDERTRHIPVVVLTSSREESDLVESYKLGVNSYIVKPVNFDNFSEAVALIGMYWLMLNEPPKVAAGKEKLE